VQKAGNYFFPLSAVEVNRKFNKLFPVQCEVKVGKNQYKEFSLQLLQLPKFWHKIKQPFTLRQALSEKIGQLTLQSPTAMAQKLHIIRSIISNLGNNSPAAETRALQQAIINYQKSFVQQSAIDDYLDEVYLRKHYKDHYYRQLMKLVKPNTGTPWPGINRYLDKIEEKYLE